MAIGGLSLLGQFFVSPLVGLKVAMGSHRIFLGRGNNELKMYMPNCVMPLIFSQVKNPEGQANASSCPPFTDAFEGDYVPMYLLW